MCIIYYFISLYAYYINIILNIYYNLYRGNLCIFFYFYYYYSFKKRKCK